ncbi:MAG: hypothetical protein IJJ85_01855 [Clostridia bacterium]|nr:hypothetical protein [Clostridia bacterium]
MGSGGAFARFANHPYRDKGNPVLSEAMDAMQNNPVYADELIKPTFLIVKAKKGKCNVSL